MKILFVCTANICRSVMAEAILRKLLTGDRHGRLSIHVGSAGVDALVGESPDDNTQLVCREHDTDVHHHHPRQVTVQLLEDTDLVLCMAEDHKRLILGAYPRFDGKVFLLTEYRREKPPKKPSVDDPTGRSLKQYAKCYARIEEEVTRIYKSTLIPIDGTMPIIPVSR